ncbi:hypothetical protein [Streptomyces palmae]|uniref:DUF485 domain-containing protein n=1 Tax=Streptomyces palmae TaxID=1701085 RepID=A0A4Z0HDY8_9ACTN|nr:hypothetical protein [Streptomyces palmae]TGB16465.1 hypothetical protein E4099_05300 [Streptomyces palmae]
MTTLTASATPASAAAAAEAAPQAVPSVHRRALLTWLAVYPTITAAFLLLGPFTAHLPLALRTLVMTAIVVPVVVYVLIPALLKANHKAVTALRTGRKGTA